MIFVVDRISVIFYSTVTPSLRLEDSMFAESKIDSVKNWSTTINWNKSIDIIRFIGWLSILI